MRDFTRLEVWQRSRLLTREIYEATAEFPRSERFGLTAQLRACSVSIGANIAEGAGRGTDADYARFVRYAAGSTNEIIHHLIIATDLGLLGEEDCERLRLAATSIRSMLARLDAALTRP